MTPAYDYVRESLACHERLDVSLGVLTYICMMEHELGPGESMRIARRAVAAAMSYFDEPDLLTQQ